MPLAAAASGEIFVGREHELRVLLAALERGIAGQGQVLMLAGEPGVGKTRTARQLALHAAERGVPVLWGRCREEPGAPPYWPWLQAIRAWADAQPDDRVRAVAGRAASHLAELVPDLADRLPPSGPAVREADAAQARFTRFDAIAGFWKRVAADGALLLILDDLHWADVPSLRLLEFVAAEIGASRIAIVGTFRDIEVSRQHPLSATLGELARHACFQRLQLAGLSPHDTGRYLAAAAGQAPAGELLAAVHAQTEGNPLFLVEMARFLAQQGLLDAARMPPAAAGTGRPWRIPQGVRELIGARLGRLSPACNRVLAAASVIGRGFELGVLVRLFDDLPEPQCVEALEEAQLAHVIEPLPRAGHYQFSHALIRETLYDELLDTRRARLHRRIGEALERRHAGQPQAHLSQLVHHFHESAVLGDAAKAIAYAEQAGARAEALLAFEEAVRFFRLALDLQQQFDPDPARRCRQLLTLGAAQNAAGAGEACIETLLEATTLAHRLGDAAALADAALGIEGAAWRIGRHGERVVALLDEALALAGGRDEQLRIALLAALCRAHIYCDHPVQANAAYREAVALARRAGDAPTLFKALTALLPSTFWPEQLDERLGAAHEALALAERAGHPEWAVGEMTGWYFSELLEKGDVDRARAVLAFHLQGAQAMRQPFLELVGSGGQVQMAILEGRFDEAEALAGATLQIAQRSVIKASGAYGMQMFTIRREQGRLGEVLPLLRHFVQTTPKSATWRPGLALVYSELDMLDEARAEFEALAEDGFAAVPGDGLRPTSLTYLAEVCARLGDARRAATLYGLMRPYAGRNMVTSNLACHGAADRYLGLLAGTLGRCDEAERHFEAALRMDARCGARPWLAHAQCDYAAFILRRRGAQATRAAALLDEALATAAALGMQALRQRAQALRQSVPRGAARPVHAAGLSAREVQVLRLVAAGLTNREIGQRLFRSENTVANHLRNILAKTGAANRAEAAAFAGRHALLDERGG